MSVNDGNFGSDLEKNVWIEKGWLQEDYQVFAVDLTLNWLDKLIIKLGSLAMKTPAILIYDSPPDEKFLVEMVPHPVQNSITQ